MEECWFRCGHSRSHLSKLILPFSIFLIKTIYFLLFVIELALDLFSGKRVILQATFQDKMGVPLVW
jgi:hypothetical protein